MRRCFVFGITIYYHNAKPAKSQWNSCRRCLLQLRSTAIILQDFPQGALSRDDDALCQLAAVCLWQRIDKGIRRHKRLSLSLAPYRDASAALSHHKIPAFVGYGLLRRRAHDLPARARRQRADDDAGNQHDSRNRDYGQFDCIFHRFILLSCLFTLIFSRFS